MDIYDKYTAGELSHVKVPATSTNQEQHLRFPPFKMTSQSNTSHSTQLHNYVTTERANTPTINSATEGVITQSPWCENSMVITNACTQTKSFTETIKQEESDEMSSDSSTLTSPNNHLVHDINPESFGFASALASGDIQSNCDIEHSACIQARPENFHEAAITDCEEETDQRTSKMDEALHLLKDIRSMLRGSIGRTPAAHSIPSRPSPTISCHQTLDRPLMDDQQKIAMLLANPKWQRLPSEVGATKLCLSLMRMQYSEDEIKTSTPTGYRGSPKLCEKKMDSIRAALYEIYGGPNFEAVWRRCQTAMSAKCKNARKIKF